MDCHACLSGMYNICNNCSCGLLTRLYQSYPIPFPRSSGHGLPWVVLVLTHNSNSPPRFLYAYSDSPANTKRIVQVKILNTICVVHLFKERRLQTKIVSLHRVHEDPTSWFKLGLNFGQIISTIPSPWRDGFILVLY